MPNLAQLKKTVSEQIKKAKDLKTLDELYQRYLGKDSEVARILSSLKKLPPQKREALGRQASRFKSDLALLFGKKAAALKGKARQEMEAKEWIDVTAPGKKPTVGHLHPLSQVKRKAMEIFQQMGFSVIEGPEIETEWYNFDALNIPKDHPARDMWDTFWLKEPKSVPHPKPETRNPKHKERLLLRTHTSPVQIRYMEKNQPPLRIVVPGRAFRHEATDASHEINFYQIEGLMVDKNVSAANFKAIMEEFLRRFFGKPMKLRLRPSFFPFVEPGFEVDASCVVCGGKGCSTCSRSGWVEMAGAGMVHPAVFKSVGLTPGQWQGFAFGLGMDRLAMMKYKIQDIRLFYSGDLRFLEQF